MNALMDPTNVRNLILTLTILCCAINIATLERASSLLGKKAIPPFDDQQKQSTAQFNFLSPRWNWEKEETRAIKPSPILS